MRRSIFCIAGFLAILLSGVFGPVNAASDEQYLRVDNSGKLLKAVRSLDWDREGPYKAKAMRLSGDIEATRSFKISAKDIPVPAECSARDDCRKAVTMMIPKDLNGVKCLRTEDVLGTPHCVEALLSEKSMFRLRGKLVDTHPWTYNFIPVIEFVSSVKQGCKSGEFLCERDKTCFQHFNGYCRYCLERPPTACACQNEQGPLPDQTACNFMISGDYICMGKCSDGQCVSTDKMCR